MSEVCPHCGQTIGMARQLAMKSAILELQRKDLLHAVQQAYLKHHCNDDRIGWDELGNILLNALCNVMGDEGYQKWIREATK